MFREALDRGEALLCFILVERGPGKGSSLHDITVMPRVVIIRSF